MFLVIWALFVTIAQRCSAFAESYRILLSITQHCSALLSIAQHCSALLKFTQLFCSTFAEYFSSQTLILSSAPSELSRSQLVVARGKIDLWKVQILTAASLITWVVGIPTYTKRVFSALKQSPLLLLHNKQDLFQKAANFGYLAKFFSEADVIILFLISATNIFYLNMVFWYHKCSWQICLGN